MNATEDEHDKSSSSPGCDGGISPKSENDYGHFQEEDNTEPLVEATAASDDPRKDPEDSQAVLPGVASVFDTPLQPGDLSRMERHRQRDPISESKRESASERGRRLAKERGRKLAKDHRLETGLMLFGRNVSSPGGIPAFEVGPVSSDFVKPSNGADAAESGGAPPDPFVSESSDSRSPSVEAEDTDAHREDKRRDLERKKSRAEFLELKQENDRLTAESSKQHELRAEAEAAADALDLLDKDASLKDTSAENLGSDPNQSKLIDAAMPSEQNLILDALKAVDGAKQPEQGPDPSRLSAEDTQQAAPSSENNVGDDNTTAVPQEPQTTQASSSGPQHAIRLGKCRALTLLVHSAIRSTEPCWTMPIMYDHLMQVMRSSSWNMHLCFIASALWIGLKVIEIDEVATGGSPDAVIARKSVIFDRLQEWVIHLFQCCKTGLSLDQMSAMDPFRHHTNPFHEQQLRRLDRAKAYLLHVKKYDQRRFTGKDATSLVDINIKIKSLNRLLSRESDVSDTDNDAVSANAAEGCIARLDRSGNLATDTHLDAYISAVEMISKIDLGRHDHFGAQMSIFHTIALCVEYLQERYDGDEPHDAKADRLDLGRVGKLVSVSKIFTKAKAMALNNVFKRRDKPDQSKTMAEDYRMHFCEEVCHRRATTARLSLHDVHKRLLSQQQEEMED